MRRLQAKGRTYQGTLADRYAQAKPADRYAVVAASLNVGSIMAAMISLLVERSLGDLFDLLFLFGLLANVIGGIMWLAAAVNQWSNGRGLAVAYVIFGGGISAILLTILLGLFMWSSL